MRYSVVFSAPCECSSRLEEEPWERAVDEFLRRGWPRGTCVSIPNTIFVVSPPRKWGGRDLCAVSFGGGNNNCEEWEE